MKIEWVIYWCLFLPWAVVIVGIGFGMYEEFRMFGKDIRILTSDILWLGFGSVFFMLYALVLWLL